MGMTQSNKRVPEKEGFAKVLVLLLDCSETGIFVLSHQAAQNHCMLIMERLWFFLLSHESIRCARRNPWFLHENILNPCPDWACSQGVRYLDTLRNLNHRRICAKSGSWNTVIGAFQGVQPLS
jgi:hypothetical protein